jgi:epoxyqueuosine reductase
VSRARLARNAAVALGNSHDARAEAPLSRALGEHPHELVREHAAWALGELAARGLKLGPGRSALETAATTDPSATVRAEAGAVLSQLGV